MTGSRPDLVERRAPARPLRARTVESLASVAPEEWDRLLVRGSGALSHALLSAWEKSELAGLTSRPVLAFQEGSSQPVAACPGYLYDLDLVGTRVPALGRPLDGLRRFWPHLLQVRAYELGSPTPLTNPFLTGEATPRDAGVRTLVEAALDDVARTGAQFFMVQNLTTMDGPAAQELMPLGFAGVPLLPTAVVDLPYGSFDEYLGSMRSSYRRRANQTISRSGSLSVEHLSRFDHLAGELARLWRLIYDRASEIRREILTPAYFAAVSAVEETSVLLLRRPDGSIASFGLLLDDAPWLSFLQCGFEEDAGRGEGAYFRLLYEIVRFGIEHRFEQVDLGLTTLAPKLDVGGVPVQLFALVKHRSPLMQRVIRGLANGPLSPDPLEPRRVFKDAPARAEELIRRRELTA